jgi:hypothetical protein
VCYDNYINRTNKGWSANKGEHMNAGKVLTVIIIFCAGCATTDYRAMMRQAGCNQDRETLTHLLARAKGRVTVGQAMYEWQEGEKGVDCE